MEVNEFIWKFVEAAMEVGLPPWKLVELTSLEIAIETNLLP